MLPVPSQPSDRARVANTDGDMGGPNSEGHGGERERVGITTRGFGRRPSRSGYTVVLFHAAQRAEIWNTPESRGRALAPMWIVDAESRRLLWYGPLPGTNSGGSQPKPPETLSIFRPVSGIRICKAPRL